VKVLHGNADKARALVKRVVPMLGEHEPCPCHAAARRALDTALITAPEARDPACWRSSTRWPAACSAGHKD
jgi:5'-methylthioadenosine phosphorylase